MFIVVSILLASHGAFAQKYLQLEITNSLKTKKYSPGEVLIYKTTEFPDEWQKAKITGIDYKTNIVSLDGKLEFITDITHVKVINPIPFYLSRMLYTFAGVSAIYGGIGDVVTGQLMPQTIIYPAGSLLLGLFFDKLVTTKVYPMGKRANLRILDLSM
jgi:hypothetical protein